MLDTVQKIVEAKRSRGRVPSVATLSEIKGACGHDPLPELRLLWKQGKVKFYHTVNNLAFYLDEKDIY